MGPQLYRCGNVEHNVNFEEYPLLLQWGRNFIVAEITYVQLRGFQQFKVLQWGRNFIVAAMIHGFPLFSYIGALQWGRNFIVVEIPRPCLFCS